MSAAFSTASDPSKNSQAASSFMHLPKAVAASWRLREADMLNAADECPPLGGKADIDQPLLQNSIYEYTA